MRAGSESDESSFSSDNSRDRGDDPTCCLGLKTPGIILRNMILPEDMWDEFPKGLTLSITDYFLYQPFYPYGRATKHSITKPDSLDMPFEEIWITAGDGVKIFAFLIKQSVEEGAKNTFPTVIMFHGNAGGIGDRMDISQTLYLGLSVNVFMVEYRGFRPSQGTPSEKGLRRDAKAAFRYLQSRPDLDKSKILVYGQSLGGGVAIDLCSLKGIRKEVAGLIVENTFTSVPSMAKKLFNFPGVKLLPPFFFNNKYNNKKKAPKLRCPTLFINGANDTLIPKGMMEKLFKRCGAKEKLFMNIENAGHNDCYPRLEFITAINELLDVIKLEGQTGSPCATKTPGVNVEPNTESSVASEVNLNVDESSIEAVIMDTPSDDTTSSSSSDSTDSGTGEVEKIMTAIEFLTAEAEKMKVEKPTLERSEITMGKALFLDRNNNPILNFDQLQLHLDGFGG